MVSLWPMLEFISKNIFVHKFNITVAGSVTNNGSICQEELVPLFLFMLYFFLSP